ncbi:betaine--homocysteine S-methyltransferase 1-like isoform X2 [Branchiostoma lanceolatum]|uniref:betaine--homocysteine S-methyltransferase 1-like isoform X1 n=1 Tax=Branchiostoma lanceolatum TaxID=7740 RepID=UPI0034551EA4
MSNAKPKGLLARLQAGETVICAEGYLFEFERRGYLKAGGFVPEVVIEHPELVEGLHREFVHAGSDVVLAFTYYAHREKMRIIGREADLERINRTALRLARKVADDTGTLMAGNICNTNIYDQTDPSWEERAHAMFKEQLEWIMEEGGCDFIVAETFFAYAEAKLALECVRKYAKGVPVVVSFNLKRGSDLIDGVLIQEALRRVAEAGADVVGLNCGRGPATTLPVLEEAVKNGIKTPLAFVPVPYRTADENPNFMTLKDVDDKGKVAFPLDLDPWLCSRSQIAAFSRRAHDIGVRYIGLCCGNASHFTRAMAEALGRQPPASRYTADMSKHAYYGTDPTLINFNTEEVCKNKF